MDIALVDELLTTTRSIRRRLDLARPVERTIIEECLEVAVQAPTGGDTARYHFVVVTDPTKRGELAKLYRRGLAEIYPPRRVEQVRQTKPALMSSVMDLADHLHEVPVHVSVIERGSSSLASSTRCQWPPSLPGRVLS